MKESSLSRQRGIILLVCKEHFKNQASVALVLTSCQFLSHISTSNIYFHLKSQIYDKLTDFYAPFSNIELQVSIIDDMLRLGPFVSVHNAIFDDLRGVSQTTARLG